MVNACETSTDPACGCSLADEESFVDCTNCILYSSGVPPPTDAIQSGQTGVAEYVQACNLAGVVLPATTLSGAVPEMTSTFAGNSFTSVDPGTLTSATSARSVQIPTPSSNAVNPTQTKSAGGIGGVKGGNKNSASRRRGREIAGGAVVAAAAAVLAIFF